MGDNNSKNSQTENAGMQKQEKVHPEQSEANKQSDQRQNYRVPTLGETNLLLSIGGKNFQISNISEQGVQIIFSEDKEHDLTPGQKLEKAELILENESFPVQARIIYITTNESGKKVSGIKLYFPDELSETKVKQYVLLKRRTFFHGGSND